MKPSSSRNGNGCKANGGGGVLGGGPEGRGLARNRGLQAAGISRDVVARRISTQ